MPSSRAEVDARIQGLVNLRGEYLFGDGVVSLGDNEIPVRAVAAADTIGIRSLVACLSDTRRTHITLRGQRVAVGRLCAQALVYTPYAQTGFRRRAFPDGWRGLPSLAADSLDLAPVQQAWSQWLREHPLTWPLLPGSLPPCPSRDAIRPERFRDSVSARGNGQRYVRIQETLADYRYVTYVVDSEFVVLMDSRPRTPTDSSGSTVLDGLSADDVESITIRKSEDEAWKWRACEGVPVVSIVTKSKRWRPRTLPSGAR